MPVKCKIPFPNTHKENTGLFVKALKKEEKRKTKLLLVD